MTATVPAGFFIRTPQTIAVAEALTINFIVIDSQAG